MTLDPRSISLNLRGTRATDVEIGFLKSRLPAGLKPDWLMALLRENALAGVNFSLTIAQGREADQ
jgi:hypothetical protein